MCPRDWDVNGPFAAAVRSSVSLPTPPTPLVPVLTLVSVFVQSSIQVFSVFVFWFSDTRSPENENGMPGLSGLADLPQVGAAGRAGVRGLGRRARNELPTAMRDEAAGPHRGRL